MKNNKFLLVFKEKKYLSTVIVGIVFVFAILVDQLTKGLIIPAFIPKVGDSLKIIPKFISFIYVKNYGAAWGIFQNNTIFLSIMTFIGLGIILAFYIVRLKKVGNRTSMLFAVSIGLMLGGAVGNLADRLIFGYVRDFINFDFINFPVFNFADTFLTIGIALLIIYICFFYSKETDTKKLQNNDNNIHNSSDQNLIKLEDDKVEKQIKVDKDEQTNSQCDLKKDDKSEGEMNE